jgi:hypothetical protein
MATRTGLYSVDPIFSGEPNGKLGSGKLLLGALEGSEPDKTKPRASLKNLPAGFEIFGSGFSPDRASVEQRGVMIGETDGVSHLSWFNNYFRSLVRFGFHPYVAVTRG